MEITISPEELANGEMSETHRDQAVHAVRTDGYVILSDIISHPHLDLVREKMDEDLHTLMTADVLPVNFVKQHFPARPTALRTLRFSRYCCQSVGDTGNPKNTRCGFV